MSLCCADLLQAVLSVRATVQLPWTIADSSRSQLRQRLHLRAATAAQKPEETGAQQDAAATQHAGQEAGASAQASCTSPAMAAVQRAALRCPLTLQVRGAQLFELQPKCRSPALSVVQNTSSCSPDSSSLIACVNGAHHCKLAVTCKQSVLQGFAG